MQDYDYMFETFLAKKELKFTLPRRLILSTVFALHEHFDAEQLYDEVRKASRNVSRATVYRTIPLLVEAGLVRKSLRSEARDTYEHIYGHPRHAHWVCRVCGALLETDMQEIFRQLQKRAESQNFDITEVSLEIKGLCWKCQNNANESQ